MEPSPFELPELKSVKKVRWNQLKPGQIALGGVSLNGSPLPELAGYPLLTRALLNRLHGKYKFLARRDLLVAETREGFSSRELGQRLRLADEKRRRIQEFRDSFFREKQGILEKAGLFRLFSVPLLEAEGTDRDYLIKDTWNSFSFTYGSEEIPSYFHRPGLAMTLGDLLTNRLEGKFNLPRDREVMLHLGVDFSRSMDSMGKLDLAVDTVNSMVREWEAVGRRLKIQIYLFSETCRPADYPLGAGGISRGDTHYGAFIKKVLHLRDRDVRNKVILLTDGLPSDWPEAMKMARLIKKNRIDYTQIIFQPGDEMRHEVVFPEGDIRGRVSDNMVFEVDGTMEEVFLTDRALEEKRRGIFSRFTEFAEACGGNQIILNVNELLHLVSVECYDRYLGSLTLAVD